MESAGVRIDDAEDFRAALEFRANLLLQGDEGTTEKALVTLLPQVQSPVGDWSAAMPWSSGSHTLTLMVRNVSGMSPVEQASLLRCIEACAGVQIVSTSATTLYDLVLDGAFREDLYYRLNTVLVSLASIHPVIEAGQRETARETTSTLSVVDAIDSMTL